MANRVWLPVLAAAMLVISGCGDSEETSDVDQEETPSADSESASTSNGADDNQPAVSSDDDTESNGADSDAIESRQAEEELERAEALEGEGAEQEAAPQPEEVEADEDTLAADPEEVLEEGGAMPGEATRSDVDDIIAETERRFEEAQKRLEEQFQEVEQQAPITDTISEEEMDERWEFESSLPESARSEESNRGSDIDALIEDTERRFEEAEQRLNEQFDAIEEERPENLSEEE